MKIHKGPYVIYAICGVLAGGYWFVFSRTNMDNFVKMVYIPLILLSASPYIIWVVHKEGEEPKEYLRDMYDNRKDVMWLARIFMMLVVSVLSSIAAIIAMGTIGLILEVVKGYI